MILAESTAISAPPERIWRFFENMEGNYTRWHRDHVSFRWLQPGGLAVGNRFHFAERLDGHLVSRTVRLTRVEPNRLMEFVPDNALIRFLLRRVSFRIEPQPGSCRLTQEVHVRIGPIGRRLNRHGFAVVQQHMHEEGLNLKAVVEASADGSA